MLSLTAPATQDDLLRQENLQIRLLDYSERQARERFLLEAATEQRRLRLTKNMCDAYSLEGEERLAREDVELQCEIGYDFIRHAVAELARAEQNKAVMRSRMQERCDTLFGSRMLRTKNEDERREEEERKEGRIMRQVEQEMLIKRAAQRDADVLQRQKEAESIRTAQAFIAGQETRDRAATLKECDMELHALTVLKRKDEIAARQLEQLNFENSDEQRRIAAEREKKIAEEKQAAAKREMEFKKEQHRLVTKCTHSRTGGSVFVGPVPRKVCLICRVRLDEVTGVYVRMT